MDGNNLRVGVVAQIQDVQNPIHVARLVMERGGCNMLVGQEAGNFACEMGVPYYHNYAKEAAVANAGKAPPTGTVGAVAIDKQGRIAAATSTGGWGTKRPGRVGDVPIIGAGTYASKDVGVSCTGDGEKIMSVILAGRIETFVAYGIILERAAQRAIEKLRATQGIGGLIAVDFRRDAIVAAAPGYQMSFSSLPKALAIRYF